MRARLRIVLLTTASLLGRYQYCGNLRCKRTVDDDAVHSLLGSYLAANFAKNENDPFQRDHVLPQRSGTRSE